MLYGKYFDLLGEGLLSAYSSAQTNRVSFQKDLVGIIA